MVKRSIREYARRGIIHHRKREHRFTPQPELEYEATVTIRVKVMAKNEVHAMKIIEGGVTMAMNVVPLAYTIHPRVVGNG